MFEYEYIDADNPFCVVMSITQRTCMYLCMNACDDIDTASRCTYAHTCVYTHATMHTCTYARRYPVFMMAYKSKKPN